MHYIKIILEYDGTNYCGWQRQKNVDNTIQQLVEDSASVLNKSFVRVTGSGRTDAGVHALGQAASFSWKVDIPVERIPLALNSNLPSDIICKKAEKVSSDFHARFDVKRKKYRYRIRNSRFPSVFCRNYVYHIYSKLDIGVIKKGAKFFKGTHDFKAFQSKNSDTNNTLRTIENISVQKKEDEIWITVIGNGFLYNMIRIIVGTLLEAALGKRSIKSIPRVIEKGKRVDAGFTAPAKGLTLLEVEY